MTEILGHLASEPGFQLDCARVEEEHKPCHSPSSGEPTLESACDLCTHTHLSPPQATEVRTKPAVPTNPPPLQHERGRTRVLLSSNRGPKADGGNPQPTSSEEPPSPGKLLGAKSPLLGSSSRPADGGAHSDTAILPPHFSAQLGTGSPLGWKSS